MNNTVIMPALNEAEAIGKVIAAIPKDWVSEIVVADNGSTDNTAEVARQAGATVVSATQRGYGSACLAAMQYISQKKASEQPEIVVFLDADYSDYPDELPLLVYPIQTENYDMIIGSRVLGKSEKGSLTVPQRFGNWLSTRLLKLLYGVKFTDLGPFRAIKWSALQALDMQDKDFGWTVEMQAKAAKQGLKCKEEAVSYRCRKTGKSKVSGNIRGSFLAGHKILYTIFKYW